MDDDGLTTDSRPGCSCVIYPLGLLVWAVLLALVVWVVRVILG